VGTATKTRTTRFYELIFVLSPALGEDEAEVAIREVQDSLAASGAEVVHVEKWGRKRLAYRVKKHGEGWFVLLHVRGPGAAVREVERRMRISERVIKYLSVRLDDADGALAHAEERIKKRAKLEEERATRAVERAAREQARLEAAAEEKARADAAAAARAADAPAAVEEPDSAAGAASPDGTAAAPNDEGETQTRQADAGTESEAGS